MKYDPATVGLPEEAIKFPWIASREGIPTSLVIWDPQEPEGFTYAMTKSAILSGLPEVLGGWEKYDLKFSSGEWYLVIRTVGDRDVPEGFEDITPRVDEDWNVTVLGDIDV